MYKETEEAMAVMLSAAAFIVAILVVAYVVQWLRLREMGRRWGEALADYFDGGLSLDELAQRARMSRRFIGSARCQALVQAAFQHAAEAKVAEKPRSLDTERSLLMALAAVKSEFGLADRYQVEGWKAGRE
jgi:hypothetical protein